VVIGAGQNGLVAANMLVDAGWQVLVLEASAQPGGAVRSGELTKPGYVHDLFSAFYPLAAVSPALVSLGLEAYGLRWRRAPLVLAHPTAGDGCAALSTDLDETAALLDSLHPGDGDAWRRLYARWDEVGGAIVDALFTPFPPVVSPLKIASKLGFKELVRFARFATVPVRRMAEEEFGGPGAGMLLAGNALHTDLSPETAMSGFYGWLLCCLGQSVGFPVPEGGAGRLIDALVGRLAAKGARVECNARVTSIVIEGGRAVGVRTAAGDTPLVDAVLADVGLPSLYRDLVGVENLPTDVVNDLGRFQYDNGTVKVDWALDGPIPWKAEEARRAGTIHVAEDMDQLTQMSADLAMRMIPARPFLVLGQMTLTDPTRSPAGTETAWAYSHTPQRPKGDAGDDGLTGTWDERETEIFVARMEDQIESLAPGFKDLISARHVFTPPMMETENANLVGGAVNGGTAMLHQQLVFRPMSGFARPETPVKGLYLASASAHPGGGVHGAPGANAAKAAIWRARREGAKAALVSLPARRRAMGGRSELS
jgi:phytoene dehydrogenase-like protein